ncbi:uncharacterized protein UBRO_20152 [Ustilago bromivora]|uniref:Uncharacterized protein n=1 Tax=Ustilago bromivora TaxID=307758 RepID=A0A1K0FVQ2_9BASI|nr:uncharacterized protein UBRO_20152 [Ustilago bromivora]
MCHKKLPLVWNKPIIYKEATGGLEEKVSIIKGKDKTAGKVSHVRSRSKFSQEEDRAQEHAVGYHTGGHAHEHMELVTRVTAWTGSKTIRSMVDHAVRGMHKIGAWRRSLVRTESCVEETGILAMGRRSNVKEVDTAQEEEEQGDKEQC